MEIAYTPAEIAFRTEVRRFLRDKLPADLRHKVLDGKNLERDDVMRWHRILHERGWVAPAWPVEHGGPGWSVIERHIFDDEIAEAGAPVLVPFAITMCAPVIMEFGTAEQKAFYLPRMLSGEHVWCQGFSEPGSGSDLASLQTRAVRDGDEYIVDGGKIWTTMAHWSNWIFCLVRTATGGKKQAGISFLLIDMSTPGISIRRITTMDGGAEFNQVFFDGVRVPVRNLVGVENEGWNCAKFLLGHERTAEARVGIAKRELKKLKAIAAAEMADGVSLLSTPRWRQRIADAETEIMTLEMTKLRALAAIRAGHAPGTEASLLKIRGTEVWQRLTELLVEAIGPHGLPFELGALDASWNGEPVGPPYAASISPEYFNNRKLSIYGGSNEIQRNIIAKTLGL